VSAGPAKSFDLSSLFFIVFVFIVLQPLLIELPRQRRM
jgi:hypothetical protein